MRDLLEKIALVEDELAIELRATTMQQVKPHEQTRKKKGVSEREQEERKSKEV